MFFSSSVSLARASSRSESVFFFSFLYLEMYQLCLTVPTSALFQLLCCKFQCCFPLIGSSFLILDFFLSTFAISSLFSFLLRFFASRTASTFYFSRAARYRECANLQLFSKSLGIGTSEIGLPT